MKINEDKSYFMIFSRSKENFTTSLHMNNKLLERKSVAKLCGVWISEDLNWSKNTSEICRKAFSKLSLLSKLKYAGTSIEDFIDIYKLFIRSLLEYCSVLFHSSLTKCQAEDLERVQKTCLKVILSDNYVSYNAHLDMTWTWVIFFIFEDMNPIYFSFTHFLPTRNEDIIVPLDQE